jgi:hypothetical protein
MKMKFHKTLVLWALLPFSLQAQQVMLSEDVAVDSTIAKRGPNRKHYTHSFMSFGAAVDGGSAGAKVMQPRIDYFNFGVRYKRRLAEHFAVGFDMTYGLEDYRLKQEAGKKLPDSLLNSRERMIFNNFTTGLYMRFNFGKRGNQLGKYVDLGGYGNIVFSHTRFLRNKLADGSTIRSRITGLNYYQLLNYGLSARVGFNKFILFGQYRVSNIFYGDKNLPELPRILAGVQFVLS